MSLRRIICTAVQYLLSKNNYRLVKVYRTNIVPVDVLDLAINTVAFTTPNFFFVQIGANDGLTSDPIRVYVKKYHWKGLLVEPHPDVFAALQQNYKEETQLIFENAAITQRDEWISLYTVDEVVAGDSPSLYSSIDSHMLKRDFGSKAPIREIRVPGLTLSTLISKHHISSISLLQIDTEGYDCDIMSMIDWTIIRPSIINFEHIHCSLDAKERCYGLLTEHGYQLHESNWDTLALLRNH